jgi:prepilin-type N-terminal cleavage/methylation domain-containing protein
MSGLRLCKHHRPNCPGFTLVELLVVICIITVLTGLGAAAMQSALGSASKTREVQAARQLVTALQSSAADNNGTYLPGIDYRAGTKNFPVFKADGKSVSGRAAHRYAFRLAPYLGNQFEGTVFVNRNKADIQKKAAGSPQMYDYLVSAYPALGMNIFCVGGVIRFDGTTINPNECISRMANARGGILAFASAGAGVGQNKYHGFSYVSPPTKQADSPICQVWQAPESWSEKADPQNFGWVDFRYDGKAVAAFLDGTVRMCGARELSDMRLWTHAAVDADDPAYAFKE